MTTRISEKEFQSTIIQAIQARNCLVFHIHDSRRQIRDEQGVVQWVGDRQARGYPDLTIIRMNPVPAWIPPDQKAFWAEIKREGENPSKEQIKYLDELPSHRAFLWRPGDFDDADRIIEYGHPPVDTATGPDTGAQHGRKCPTCWTCWGRELIVQKRKRKRNPNQASFIERPRT